MTTLPAIVWIALGLSGLAATGPRPRPSPSRRSLPTQRVASYDLKATLDPDKHSVVGTEHLRWTDRSYRPVASLYFHLYLNAFEGPDSTFMVEKARYGTFRSDVQIKKGEWGWIDMKSASQAGRAATIVYVHPDAGPMADHTVVRVDLPSPIPSGATGEVDREFFDQLPRVVARTGYFAQYHLIAQVVSEGGGPGAAWRTQRNGSEVDLPRGSSLQ